MALHSQSLEQGELWLDPEFLKAEQSSKLEQLLLQQLPWRHDELTVFGKAHLMPRLHCFQSDRAVRYQYSGLELEAEPFHPKVAQLKRYLEAVTSCSFNAVLINLYRDGTDKMGWHSDDEPELGLNPTIASISLGAQRCFKLRHKNKAYPDVNLELASGSLLLMAGELQTHWQHSLPVRKKVERARINLTFRQIIDPV